MTPRSTALAIVAACLTGCAAGPDVVVFDFESPRWPDVSSYDDVPPDPRLAKYTGREQFGPFAVQDRMYHSRLIVFFDATIEGTIQAVGAIGSAYLVAAVFEPEVPFRDSRFGDVSAPWCTVSEDLEVVNCAPFHGIDSATFRAVPIHRFRD